jgi:site-specific recombinase XerD
MILGRGQAHTAEAIIAEYRQFLRDFHPAASRTIQVRLLGVPEVMERHTGKSILEWTDEDIINLYGRRSKHTQYGYTVLLAFLFFRGYRRASLELLTTLRPQLSRHFRTALAPMRERLQAAEQELSYAPLGRASELNLLLYLLAVVNKPLEELTRANFDAFREEYQTWYRETSQQATQKLNARLFRLEAYLIHWAYIPPAKRVLRHEEHFARLRHEQIRSAILLHLQWCAAKYVPSTIYTRRAALLNFFLWLQDNHPNHSRLDSVTRSVALSYLHHLNSKVAEGIYCPNYAIDLQRGVRLFYNFVIDERLETTPDRNPFTIRDLPRQNVPVPRCLTDQEVRSVLTYCANGASLKERTLVITLLHTGIRAAELSALKISNIVQIQGIWKLHIQEGKGLKDRLIPLTPQCLEALHAWQSQGWEGVNDYLFTHHGRPWTNGRQAGAIIRKLGLKLGLEGLSPHRFRHTFAVALLNYGMRESALQKLMGHATLNMTLEYARILDKTVEQAFHEAVEKMQSGPISWVPDFLQTDEYATLAAEESVNWIRLPHGYCRRHPKLHCESDVKCLLCDRYCGTPADLPRLQEMHDQFLRLGMPVKAEVVNVHLIRLQDASAVGKNESLVAVTNVPT